MNSYPCPGCGNLAHQQKLVAEDGAELPIRQCPKCDEEWEDDDTFRARSESHQLRKEIGIGEEET